MKPVSYIVTIKLKNNPNHNPQNKVEGECPAFGGFCSDVTGAHHTTVVSNFPSADHVGLHYETLGFHVTRIERLPVNVEH